VLFTSSFPYFGGEQFLETEIEYLSKSFSKIVIVPLKKHQKLRSIPDNVVVDNFITNTKSRHFFKMKSLFGKYFLTNFSFNINDIKYLFKNAVYVENYKKWIDRFLKKNKIDECLFYSYWFEAPTSALSLVKTKKSDLKFVTRVHGGDLFENLYGLDKFPGRQKIISNITKIFSVSTNGKNHIVNNYITTKEKIEVSRLGVKGNENLSKASKDGKLRIVSCSSLIPLKRVNLIIEGLHQLKSKNIEIIWTHIGDGELKIKLENESKIKLGGKIEYNFLGYLTNKEVLQFYKNNPTDVFINTSSSEGIPVSIMEAHCFGIPVIATDVGGIKEIVNLGNGFLLSKNPTDKEIAKAIFDVINKKYEWKKKRIESFENWGKKFNAELNYKNFTNNLKKLL